MADELKPVLDAEGKPVLDADGKPVMEPVTVTFNDAQKSAINTIVEERLNRQKKTLEKTHADALAAAVLAKEQEIEKLKTKIKPVGSEGDGDGEAKQFERILKDEKARTAAAEERARKSDDDLKKTKSDMLSVRKDVEISNAAQSCNFYNLAAVKKLTADMVEFDDESGSWVVRENGAIVRNDALKPASLEEFYRSYAAHNQYLVNGDVRSGAGSGEGKHSIKPDGKILSRADFRSNKDKADWIGKYGAEAFEKLAAAR